MKTSNLTTSQIVNIITDYVNNSYSTWNYLSKKYAEKNSFSLLRKVYKVLENPELVNDSLFKKVREKSIWIATTYHPENLNRIIDKFENLKKKRKNFYKKDSSENEVSIPTPSYSITELISKREMILFQLSNFDDSYIENDCITKEELEKELDMISRKISELSRK